MKVYVRLRSNASLLQYFQLVKAWVKKLASMLEMA